MKQLFRATRTVRDKMLGGEQDGRRVLLSDEEYRDKSAALTFVTEGKALTVESVDFLLEVNRSDHHTDEFEQEDLVLRRGQAFSFKLHFDRAVNKKSDILFIKFAYGSRPQESKGTIIRLPINLDGSPSTTDNWQVTMTDLGGNVMTLCVTSEADSMIGKYELLFETKLRDSEKDFANQDLDTFFYLLFNPWEKEDVVYMEDEGEREEYVVRDTGYIWVGSVKDNRARPWNFGQFETPVLDVALGLLDKGELADTGRNSAVSIIRCLSALVNSMDDNGLLEGRWTSEYPKGCTRPSDWTGSVPIIEEFYRTGRPVKFGQCWVFSGVITTLLRCLGIPTRSVTNFESAHDTDCSMTIDRHFNEEGEPVEDLNDSVWNFHVWNESYFRRLDLPRGRYDGWQAHDATPQELSEGVMRCGPTPLAAVREGEVYLNYDTGFVFSEVNGDKIDWMVCQDGSMKVSNINRHSIGRYISTKAVGSSERLDITYLYKYPEGSPEERRVVEFVEQFSTRRKQNIYRKEIGKKEIDFDLLLANETVPGDDLEVGVKVKNLTSDPIKVKVTLTLASTFYTGVAAKTLKGEIQEASLAADQETILKMVVVADDYVSTLNPELKFKLTAACRVVESNRFYADSETFTLKFLSLEFDVPKKVCSRIETKVPLTFKNVTKLRLHNCVFQVEGPYIVKAKSYHIRKVVNPGDDVSVDVVLLPYRLGNRVISATFSSNEIADVLGEAVVHVVSKAEWDEPDGGVEAMEVESAVRGGAGDGLIDKRVESGAVIDKEAESGAVTDKGAESEAIIDKGAESEANIDKEAGTEALNDKERIAAEEMGENGGEETNHKENGSD
ncbi:protein-glutamine gamma-glutamyltransferase 4-like isoform X2 [Dreissena polymorpha]|uniref:Transglutaminase-like domain-containing protein n=1 Tax=Dreissena polymorpha TaxID=45954 RepID=A0A9D4EDV7_DREPO|nr:protein-glutamine gamma-glutamyltransferase 4-like isoform X2 [Dreissena polymorpha]KAH3778779.1 hypothetical protein DPMN_180250 [Dreissena polymorpha]